MTQKYAYPDSNDMDTAHDKLELILASVEVFNFKRQYKHFVFDRLPNEIRKRIENTCQVRVAIAV